LTGFQTFGELIISSWPKKQVAIHLPECTCIWTRALSNCAGKLGTYWNKSHCI